ncbi:MAG: hypothetical protein E7430_06530 [Ruminococcaceae bacterium]|nr:hypothetical protein [Oscillospiraceae bacterium]
MKTNKAKTALSLAMSAIMILTPLTACDKLSNASQSESFSYPYILPNTYIANIDVGGLSKDEALNKLSNTVSSMYDPLSVTVSINGSNYVLEPAQNFSFTDVEALVDQAYNNGRTGDDKADYDAALETEFRINANPQVTVDFDDLKRKVDDIVSSLSYEGADSVYELTDDTLLITRGEPSAVIDGDALFDAVKSAFEQSITTVAWAIEETEVEELNIDRLWYAVDTPVTDAHYDIETESLVESTVGVTFDLEAAKTGYESLDYGGSLEIPLTITEPELKYEDIEGRLYAELLGSCDSTLEGSTPNRKRNLELVSEAINGTVLQPGDVFSFNDTVGERTAAKGYKEAGVYIGGQTQDQLGGGICQGASSIYLAALRANLEIVERTQHDYLVTYVPMGCDATIYWQVFDFKFKNCTEFPMRIDMWVADNFVHVELWGTNISGEYAEMTYEVLASYGYDEVIEEDPEKEVGYEEITTYPYVGYTVDTYRNVYDKDGNLLYTNYEARTNYKSRNQVTTIGTKGLEPEVPEGEAPAGSTETGDVPVTAPEETEQPEIILQF